MKRLLSLLLAALLGLSVPLMTGCVEVESDNGETEQAETDDDRTVEYEYDDGEAEEVEVED